jgi:pilus assembly protein CpaC
MSTKTRPKERLNVPYEPVMVDLTPRNSGTQQKYGHSL